MDRSLNGKLRSGELARLAGVSTDTLRHYERKGVLPAPHRSRNGYREYPPETLERVRLVRRAIAIGFTLEELSQILKVRDRGDAPCRNVFSLAQTKLQEIEERLKELSDFRNELHGLLADWQQRLSDTPPDTRAGLLEALASNEPGTKSARPSLASHGLNQKRGKRK